MTLTDPGALHRDGNATSVGWNATNITGNATTVVKNAPGFVHTITINTKGATSNIAKLYDGPAATGTLLATIDTTANVGFLLFDVKCDTNITVVTSAGTAADLTVTYV